MQLTNRFSKPTPTRVIHRNAAIIGIERQLQDGLERLFLDDFNGHITPAGTDDADLLIIDIDTDRGRLFWGEQANAHSHPPMILLSADDVATDGATFVIRKPIDRQALISALTDATTSVSSTSMDTESQKHVPTQATKQLSNSSFNSGPVSRIRLVENKPSKPGELRKEHEGSPISTRQQEDLAEEQNWKRFIGTAPDIDPGNPEQAMRAQFDPDRYLIGKLTNAARLSTKSGKPVCYRFAQGSISVSSKSGTAVVDLHQSRLQTLATVPVSEEDASFMFVDEIDDADQSAHKLVPLDRLLWTTALFAARGRVPVGTDFEVKVTLSHWPDRTHISAFPNMERILNLLSRGPTSLIDAASELKISQRYVFAFFTAADALGLIEKSAADEPLKRDK